MNIEDMSVLRVWWQSLPEVEQNWIIEKEFQRRYPEDIRAKEALRATKQRLERFIEKFHQALL